MFHTRALAKAPDSASATLPANGPACYLTRSSVPNRARAFETMTSHRGDISPADAKQAILDYCLRKGALAAGVADLEAIERIAPAGHRPSDLMPRVRSVISLGVGGQTQGAWTVPAKALAYFGSTETRAYTIAYGCSFFIESRFGARSIYCPPDLDNESGPRVPLQSLKLHAELAGLGARSMAGDILLHPEFGYMYLASVFTELDLPPDAPMAENPCPHPSCVSLFRKTGQTPCMKFCPVQCLFRKTRSVSPRPWWRASARPSSG